MRCRPCRNLWVCGEFNLLLHEARSFGFVRDWKLTSSLNRTHFLCNLATLALAVPNEVELAFIIEAVGCLLFLNLVGRFAETCRRCTKVTIGVPLASNRARFRLSRRCPQRLVQSRVLGGAWVEWEGRLLLKSDWAAKLTTVFTAQVLHEVLPIGPA